MGSGASHLRGALGADCHLHTCGMGQLSTAAHTATGGEKLNPLWQGVNPVPDPLKRTDRRSVHAHTRLRTPVDEYPGFDEAEITEIVFIVRPGQEADKVDLTRVVPFRGLHLEGEVRPRLEGADCEGRVPRQQETGEGKGDSGGGGGGGNGSCHGLKNKRS